MKGPREKYPNYAPSPEQSAEILTRESVLASLREGAGNKTATPEAYVRWIVLGEERRDRGEVSQEALTKESIEVLVETGWHSEAVYAAQDVVNQFGPKLEEGEVPYRALRPEGNDLYSYCVSVIEMYG